MPLQRALPDGDCCFRALAVAVVEAFTGFNCGGGTPRGRERTVADVVANAAAAWLRFLAVGALCSSAGAEHGVGDPIPTHPRRRSMLEMLTDAHARLSVRGLRSTRDLKTLRLALAAPTTFHGVCAPARVLPNGLAAEQFVELNGRQTFRRYCCDMQHPRTWGGVPELYVASTVVLQLPVSVYDLHADVLQTFWPDGQPPAHHLILLYSGSCHYDAVLPEHGCVPPLLSLAQLEHGSGPPLLSLEQLEHGSVPPAALSRADVER